MINIKDRVPGEGKVNRKLITPEGGGEPYYATITRADGAEEMGTAINRRALMAIQGFFGNRIVRNPDGSITETNEDGDTKVTERNADGSISEIFISGTMTITKTTIKDPDGTIREVITG